MVSIGNLQKYKVFNKETQCIRHHMRRICAVGSTNLMKNRKNGHNTTSTVPCIYFILATYNPVVILKGFTIDIMISLFRIYAQEQYQQN